MADLHKPAIHPDRLVIADARSTGFPDAHFQTIVTSPPYWGLRSYQPDNPAEIGAGSVEDYLADLRLCAEEWFRVTADTGVLWLNLSDTSCVDEDTEIFTQRGWLKFNEVEVGDRTLGLDPDGGASWTEIRAVNIHEPAPRRMLSMEGDSGHSSLTTANHRWYVERRTTTSGIGQSRPGSSNGFATLSAASVDQIRSEYATLGTRQVDLADRFGVTQTAISKIITGRTWNADSSPDVARDATRRLVRSWVPAVLRSDELGRETRVAVAQPVRDLPTASVHADSLVEVVAWYWTEGNDRRSHGGAGLWITQQEDVHPQECARIRAALGDLFGPPVEPLPGASRWGHVPPAAWREDRSQFPKINWRLNGPAADVVRRHVDADKVVDPRFLCALTQSQLDLFIEVSVMADGHQRRGGEIALTQSNVSDQSARARRRADAFHYACTLAGRYATLRSSTATMSATHARRTGVQPHPLWTVQVGSKQYFKPGRTASRWVTHLGLVWCPTTAAGSWLARRNGVPFYTGNSGSGGAGGDYNTGGAKDGKPRWRQGRADRPPMSWLNIPHRVVEEFVSAGWLYRSCITWNKGRLRPEDLAHARRPGVSSEFIFMLSKSRAYPFHADRLVERGNVWTFPPARGRNHLAPFPLELPMRCIPLTTNPGDRVLDPFVGSGTTIEAAEMVGRIGYGCDIVNWMTPQGDAS